MSQAFEGVPEVISAADLAESAVHLTVDATVYPLEAVYGAAFTFIDRAFVFIDVPAEGTYRVVLSTKKPGADEAALKTLIGAFANELLAAAYRKRIVEDNRATIETVTMQALSGAMGAPSLDDLEDFDFSEEPFEDPLGIAMSWEQKYGKDNDARKEGEADQKGAKTAAEAAANADEGEGA